jgi:hypothetical protein
MGVLLMPGVTRVKDGAAVTELTASGAVVRFRIGLGDGASCALAALPGRGYRGSCLAAGGDSIPLSLVPPVPGMLLPEHEIHLAQAAAPPQIAGQAAIHVLGERGYWQAVAGTNEFSCYVERPTPRDAWPICHNRAGSDLLKVETFRARLRAAGLAETKVVARIAEAYRRGRFRAPPSGSIGYMLSPFAWTADSAGSPVFIAPHLHFYAPFVTNARIGVDPTRTGGIPMRVEREGLPDASVIVGVRVDTTQRP